MSLVGWWPLNGNDTKRIGEFDSYEVGSVQYGSGKFGQCYDNTANNGSGVELIRHNDFVEYESNYSFSLWFKSTTTSGNDNERILSRDASEYPTILIDQNQSGNQNVSISDATSPGSYAVNEWHHIVLTIDVGANESRVFVDGNLENTGGYSGQNSARPYVIGGNTEGDGDISGGHFVGKIDDVRLYDHALSTKEVAELSRGKLLHYKFDQPGDVTDASGQGNSGQLNGPTFSDNSVIGTGAYDFDGSNDWIGDANLGYSDSATFSFWLNKDNLNQGYLLDGRTNGNWWFLSNYSGYDINFLNDVTYNGISSDEWNHITVTCGPNESKLYINGNLEDTGPGTTLNLTSVRVGTRYTNSNYLDATMDDIRVYAKKLSASEVQEVYEQRASIDSGGTTHSHELSETVDTGLNTSVESAGLDTGSAYTRFTVNGSDVAGDGRGINVAEVDRQGNLVRWGSFDVYGSRTSETDNLVTFIENSFAKNILLLGADDHPGRIQSNGVNKIQSLGSKYIDNVSNDGRSSWAFICIKDYGWRAEKFAPSGEGPVTASHIFPDNMSIEKTGTISSGLTEIGPAPGSLVGWWPLDGSTRDLSVNNNDGTNNGATVTSGLGQSAYLFGGNSEGDSIELGFFNETTHSLSCWFFLNSFQSAKGFFGANGGGNNSYSIIWADSSDETIRYVLDDEKEGGQSFNQITGSTLNTGTWYHAALTYNAQTGDFKGYLNGSPDGSATRQTGVSIDDLVYVIGNRSAQDSQFALDGKVQDARIYSRALTAPEVAQLYKMTNPQTKQQLMQTSNGQVLAKEQFDERL